MDVDVSFSKDIFTKDEFDVDRFLQESCQKSGLHKLHKELGAFIKYLQSMIVDLVNNESNAIVNLSSDLKVLQNKFGNLSNPLGQLKEELMQIYKMIDTNLSNVKYLLNKKEAICQQRSLKMNELRMLTTNQKIGSILEAHSGEEQVEMEVIERSVNQYIMQHMFSQLCDGQKYSLRNTDTLHRILSHAFLRSVREQDSEKSTRCLQMYMLMNAQTEAEGLYRCELVRPALARYLTEEQLAFNSSELSIILDHVLEFTNREGAYLTGLVSRGCELSGFEFGVRAIWAEAEEQLGLNLGCVFAPGNPAVFQRRFLQATSFLEQLEARLGPMLKTHPSYRRHLQRWNLKVYFEIRQMEVVEAVEQDLEQGEREASNGFRTRAFEGTWLAAQHCFSSEVFLPQLLDRFWRLALQALSRLDLWTQGCLDASNEDEEQRLELIGRLHGDVLELRRRLLAPGVPLAGGLAPMNLEAALRGSLRALTEDKLPARVRAAEETVAGLVREQCARHIGHVAHIPRLYRKTNRGPPAAASPYVAAACRPVQQLLERRLFGEPEAGARVATAVYASLSEQYRTLVQSVLTSVARTEESLRRLKKARAGPPECSDDQKIRQQLLLDVRGWAQLAGPHTDVSQLLALVEGQMA